MKTIILMLWICAFNINGWKWRKKKSKAKNEQEEDEDAAVFCRSRSRLIKLEKSDDFYIVDGLVNSSVLMQCKFW